MPQIDVSWDYSLWLEWYDDEGGLCDGPDFEDVLPGSLLRRIYAWVDEMNVVYGWLGEDESMEVPEVVARRVHQELVDIRAEIQALGFRVTPLDEWWVRAAEDDDSGL